MPIGNYNLPLTHNTAQNNTHLKHNNHLRHHIRIQNDHLGQMDNNLCLMVIRNIPLPNYSNDLYRNKKYLADSNSHLRNSHDLDFRNKEDHLESVVEAVVVVVVDKKEHCNE